MNKEASQPEITPEEILDEMVKGGKDASLSVSELTERPDFLNYLEEIGGVDQFTAKLPFGYRKKVKAELNSVLSFNSQRTGDWLLENHADKKARVEYSESDLENEFKSSLDAAGVSESDFSAYSKCVHDSWREDLKYHLPEINKLRKASKQREQLKTVIAFLIEGIRVFTEELKEIKKSLLNKSNQNYVKKFIDSDGLLRPGILKVSFSHIKNKDDIDHFILMAQNFRDTMCFKDTILGNAPYSCHGDLVPGKNLEKFCQDNNVQLPDGFTLEELQKTADTFFDQSVCGYNQPYGLYTIALSEKSGLVELLLQIVDFWEKEKDQK